ncbi:ankyrin repeat-containing domain protein, partial [Ilyonectria destructans]
MRNHRGRTPLHKACWKGRTKIIELLLEKKAETRVLDSAGRSPLHFASKYGHVQAIQLLLRNDNSLLDIVESRTGRTALHEAVKLGHDEAASSLLEAGSRVDIRDSDGKTPLMAATTLRREGIM